MVIDLAALRRTSLIVIVKLGRAQHMCEPYVRLKNRLLAQQPWQPSQQPGATYISFSTLLSTFGSPAHTTGPYSVAMLFARLDSCCSCCNVQRW